MVCHSPAGQFNAPSADQLDERRVFTTDRFNFGTTLTIIHFLTTTIGLEILARFGFFEKKHLSIPAVLPLSLAFSGFVVLTNLSLQFNSVGFCGFDMKGAYFANLGR